MRETGQDSNSPQKPADQARAERLKAALKANIAKRKAQARARDTASETTQKKTR